MPALEGLAGALGGIVAQDHPGGAPPDVVEDAGETIELQVLAQKVRFEFAGRP